MASRSSRPLHSRNHSSSSILSKKHSNVNGFSAKNAYDGVFAGPTKFGAPNFSTRVDDYAEIFGASRASSIPFLDLSALEETNVSSSDLRRSSKLEYSKIFGGGFGDEEEVALYEEMFDEPNRGGKFSESDKAQTPAKTVSPSKGSDTLNDTKEHQEFSNEASNQSFGGVKQFNMSYHKSGQRSNKGTNGTTHVAQLQSIPGFTHFINENENTPLLKTRCDESVPALKTDVNLDMNSSDGIIDGKQYRMSHLTKKQKPEGVVKHKNGFSLDAFYSNDKQFSVYDSGLKTQPSKVSPPSSLSAHELNPKVTSERSMPSNLEVPKSNASKGGAGDCSPTFSDEDVDVNSAAAASATALRKAIQRAQESIRLAKESMERKKDGLQSSTKPISKSGLDAKERKENKVSGEVKRTKEKNAKGICERVDAVLHVFAGMERQNVMRSGKVAPEFHDSEELFIGREAMNKVESAEECEAQTQTSELENSNKHKTASLPFMHEGSKNNIIYSADTDECETGGTKTAKLILRNQEENVMRAIEQTCEGKDMEEKLNVKMAEEWEEHGNILRSTQEFQEQVKNEKTTFFLDDEETKEKQKAFDEQERFEKIQKGVLEREQNEKISKDDHEKEEHGNPPEEVLKQDEIEKRLQKACEWQNCENNLKQGCEVGSKEEKQNDNPKGEDNEKRLDKVYELEVEIDEKVQSDTHDGKKFEKIVKEDCEWEGNEMTHVKACKYEETGSIETGYGEYNEKTEMTQEAVKDEKNCDAYKRDASESLSDKQEASTHDEHCNMVEVSQEVIGHEENEKVRNFYNIVCEYSDDEKEQEAVKATYEPEMKESFQMAGLAESSAERIEIEIKMENATEAFIVNGNVADFGLADTSFGQTQIDQKEKEIELASNLENGLFEHDSEENKSQDSEAEAAFDQEEGKTNLDSTREEKQWTKIGKKEEPSQPPNAFEGEKKTTEIEEEIKTSENTGNIEENVNKTSAMEEDETKGTVEKEVEAEIAFDHEEDKSNVERAHEERVRQWIEASLPPSVFEAEEKTMELDEEIEISQNAEENEENLNITFTVQEKETEAIAQREVKAAMEEDETKGTVEKEVEAEIAFDQEDDKSNVERAHEERVRQWVEASLPPSVFEAEEKSMELDEEIEISQNAEENEENLNITFTVQEKETEATAQREVKAEKEHLQKNDEAKTRERDREKERIAVERAIREARERAFAEARERAERAAVERATAEARQRVLAEVREKFEKASSGTKTSAEKASIEAKLRVERAAVERATAEARERALEKALSQKATSRTREKGGNIGAERFSGTSRDNGIRSTDDSQRVDRANGESALRHKARLESHQRIMERAAKALAEKNRRDILAQKEQAERNRLAGTLDADVKRWSSGKEGNLRALLSTLQYILGPDSGWQPVSLTDIITTNAVKKAYRKATLCVHPDKLQQRGATIQQKYICEKVFDLLKAAWNKFDSEER